MMSLGIDRHSYLAYEGMFSTGRGIWPSPVITSVAIESSAAQPLEGPMSWEAVGKSILFREDAYDPVARVRRGRFYKSTASQPQTWQVPPHPAVPSQLREFGNPGVSPLELMTFTAHRISGDLAAIKPAQPLIVLGDSQQFTVWVLISIEMSVGGEEIVALRARSTFGALPNLVPEAIPAAGNEKVNSAIGILSEDLHKAGPQSVIDRSRDAIAWILSIYLQSKEQAESGLDLGNLITRLNGAPNDIKKEAAASAANVVRLLHARGKSSEQERRPMVRSLQEQDAALAVLCVGTILCDLGWATWS